MKSGYRSFTLRCRLQLVRDCIASDPAQAQDTRLALSTLRNVCKAASAALLLCVVSSPRSSHGQAVPGGVRGEAIDIFATGAISRTDYSGNDLGVTIGADFTRHFRLLDPSLTVRYNKQIGDTVGEKSFVGGLKLERAYKRFHPYLQLMFGYGVITFNRPSRNADGSFYSYDDSSIYDVGGGFDYDLSHSFALKADVQYQFWSLGRDPEPITFHPAIVGIGLIYRIPYHSLRPRNH